MKKVIIILAIILILGIGFSYHFIGRRTYELDLPIYDNLKSITINKNIVINGNEAMKDILYTIKRSKKIN